MSVYVYVLVFLITNVFVSLKFITYLYMYNIGKMPLLLLSSFLLLPWLLLPRKH